MPDNNETIWPLEPHTHAKHDILVAYLKAWSAILSKQSPKKGTNNNVLRFIDGFAGPGIYSKGELGSPILAIKTILEGDMKISKKVRFTFIEKDRLRFESLEHQIEKLRADSDASNLVEKITTRNDECESVVLEQLDKSKEKGVAVGPAFFFLDQFGYSHVSMNLIKRIMSNKMCEVFTYLHWNRMNQCLTDKLKWNAINSAFGGTQWKEALDLSEPDRSTYMRECYKDSLRQKACVKFTWHIAMCDKNHKLTHWLFFCTNSLKGLEEMKRAMWKVDKSGSFQFSSKDDPNQFNLFENYSDQHLATDIHQQFSGKTISVNQIKEFVLTETPMYLYKSCLKTMENEGTLTPVKPPEGRKRGSFGDEKMKIEIH